MSPKVTVRRTWKILGMAVRWGVAVPAVALLIYLALPVVHYRGLVIHHTASSRDNLESIRRQHRSRFLLDAAYHMILSNGSTDVPRGHLETTRWYALGLPSLATRRRLCNLTTLQICVVGNYETDAMPAELAAELAQAVSTLQAKYGIPDDRVHLHRDCNATKCPGKNVTVERVLQWKRQASGRVAPGVTEQQRAAISAPYLFGGWLTVPWTVVALVSGSLLAGRRWMRRRRGSGARNRVRRPRSG